MLQPKCRTGVSLSPFPLYKQITFGFLFPPLFSILLDRFGFQSIRFRFLFVSISAPLLNIHTIPCCNDLASTSAIFVLMFWENVVMTLVKRRKVWKYLPPSPHGNHNAGFLFFSSLTQLPQAIGLPLIPFFFLLLNILYQISSVLGGGGGQL